MTTPPTLVGKPQLQPTTTHRPTPTRRTQPKRRRAPAKPKSSTITHSDPTYLYTPYSAGLPDWDWDLVKPIPSAQHNDGYDAHAAALTSRRREAAMNATNALLSDGDYQMRIFVTDVAIDTELSGKTAQSNMTRDFYPHNFVQPAFTIKGVSLSQGDYALLCEFIHSAQRKAVANGYQNLTQLWVAGRDSGHPHASRGWDGARTQGRAVILSQKHMAHTKDPNLRGVANGRYVSQTVRGAHQPVMAKGYVANMPRKHERFQYAVQWEFSFVVAAVLQGIYTDPRVTTATTNPTWQQMLADAKKTGVITTTKALLKENRAALAYARANAATMFPNAQAQGSTGNNTGTGGSAAGVPTGQSRAWKVKAVQETTDLAGNSGGSAYGLPLTGYSELASNLGSTGGPFDALGNLPGGLEMYISANGKTVKAKKVDVGAGSTGPDWTSSPRLVMGLYPAVSDALGLTGGGPYMVTIWRADGQPLHPVAGTAV